MNWSSTKDVAALGTILGVWAHPDDESFLTAGLMAAAVDNGQTVACITATKGEAGQTSDEIKWPKANLADIRAKELEEAFKIIGVTNHHWLGYKDGHCGEVPDDEAVKQVLKYIEMYRPDTILTFPPDGITGHDDHKSASRWAVQAVKKLDRKIALYYAVDTQENYDEFFKELDEKFNVYFNIDKPVLIPRDKCDICFYLPSELRIRKMRALKAMASQTKGMFDDIGEQVFTEALKTETFVKADLANSSKWPL